MKKFTVALAEDCQLEELIVGFNPIRTKGVEAIADCSALSKLRVLSLAYAEIDDGGLSAIGRSRNIERLEILDVSGRNDVSQQSCEQLFESSQLPNLKKVFFSYDQVAVRTPAGGVETQTGEPDY